MLVGHRLVLLRAAVSGGRLEEQLCWALLSCICPSQDPR